MKPKESKFLLPLVAGAAALAALGWYIAFSQQDSYSAQQTWLCVLGGLGLPLIVGCIYRPALSGMLRLGIAGGLVAYLAVSGRIDITAMRRCTDEWPWLLLGGILLLNQPICGCLRWRYLLQVQGIHLSVLESFRLCMVGFFFSMMLPGSSGGDVVRVYVVSKEKGNLAASITTVLLERLIGLMALLGLCVVALAINWDFLCGIPKMMKVAKWLLIVLAGGAIFLTCLMSRRLAAWLGSTWLGRREFRGKSGLIAAQRALHAYHGSYWHLGAAAGISVVSHLASAGAAFCFSIALHMPELGFGSYLLLVPLGFAVNSIPALPGGLGLGQSAFYWLFKNALPAYAEAGPLGAALMTFIHISLFGIACLGGIVYAAGGHRLRDAVSEARTHEGEDIDVEQIK